MRYFFGSAAVVVVVVLLCSVRAMKIMAFGVAFFSVIIDVAGRREKAIKRIARVYLIRWRDERTLVLVCVSHLFFSFLFSSILIKYTKCVFITGRMEARIRRQRRVIENNKWKMCVYAIAAAVSATGSESIRKTASTKSKEYSYRSMMNPKPCKCIIWANNANSINLAFPFDSVFICIMNQWHSCWIIIIYCIFVLTRRIRLRPVHNFLLHKCTRRVQHQKQFAFWMNVYNCTFCLFIRWNAHSCSPRSRQHKHKRFLRINHHPTAITVHAVRPCMCVCACAVSMKSNE